MKIYEKKTRFHRFVFEFPYHPERVSFCRLLKGTFGWQEFSFDHEAKVWAFSKPEIVQALKEKYPMIEISGEVLGQCEVVVLAEQAYENQVIRSGEIKKQTDSNLIVPIKGELFPYQKIGVEFLLNNKGNALLCDTQGLGKTLEYIGYFTLSGHKKGIIVCPASMKYTWENEVLKWTDLKPYVVKSNTKFEKIEGDVSLVIVNYDLLVKFAKQLIECGATSITWDEAHYLKNSKAKRTKAAVLIAKHMQSVTCMTGTPVLSRPIEMYSLLKFIDGKRWANWMQFAVRYCGGRYGRFGFDATGATNIAELREKISPYFLRRTKEEVLPDLPPKRHIHYPVEMDEEHSKLYDIANRDLVRFLREMRGMKNTEITKSMQAEKLVKLNILREISALGKVEAAAELVHNILDSGSKVIVFSSFIKPLDRFKKLFPEAVTITGQVDLEERPLLVKQFQSDPNTRVFLGGIKSAGVGLTLTAAQSVVFLDYSWTPADHFQAEDRAHRIGSDHESIDIYQLSAHDTMDGFMQKLLEPKYKLFNELVDYGSPAVQQSIMGDVLRQIEESID